MPYTTYEIFVPATVGDLVGFANAALHGFGAPRVETLDWTARMNIGDPPQKVRMTLGANPNSVFCRLFADTYGMVPSGSLGIDTEHENDQGCGPLSLLLRNALRVTDSDMIVTLNDGGEAEAWETVEIFRRTNLELRFAPWKHALTFNELVLSGK